jgi:hypothetical protein
MVDLTFTKLWDVMCYLAYESEAWRIEKADEKTLSVSEMNFMR